MTDVASCTMRMQVFTLPVYGKLLAMVAVGAPLVLLGAIAYRRTTGSDWCVHVPVKRFISSLHGLTVCMHISLWHACAYLGWMCGPGLMMHKRVPCTGARRCLRHTMC